LASACGGAGTGTTDPPPGGQPNDGPALTGRIADWVGGSGAVEVRDSGPFFFPTASATASLLASGVIADDGSFDLTLPEEPTGTWAVVEPDTVSTFPCDASGLDLSVAGARVLLADFGVRDGAGLAFGVQQGDSTLFVRPEPGDLWVFWAYADRAVTVQGSESCPAVPFVLEYDLVFEEGWNTFSATFVSQTEARNYLVTTGDVPDEVAWFQPQ